LTQLGSGAAQGAEAAKVMAEGDPVDSHLHPAAADWLAIPEASQSAEQAFAAPGSVLQLEGRTRAGAAGGAAIGLQPDPRGGIQTRDHLPGGHLIADIDGALDQLPADPEGERDVVLGLDGPGQRDAFPARQFFDRDDPDRANGFGDRLRCLFVGRQTGGDQGRYRQEADQGHYGL
jgi:hypothetical protein